MVKHGERKNSFAVNSDPNSYSKCNTDTYFYPNANTDLDRSRTPTSAPMSQQWRQGELLRLCKVLQPFPSRCESRV